jgi:uncharacterized protein (TIGR02300 family)
MPDLGTKHECHSCGAKFYDFGRSPVICPKCGADQADAKSSTTSVESAGRKRRRDAASRRSDHDEDEEVAAPTEDVAIDEADDLTEELGEAEEETLDEDD